MYERLEECPICQNRKFSNKLICQDHTVSKESFAIVKCEKCSLLFTNPRPQAEKLGEYYQSSNYISHTNKGNSLINILYKIVRTITLRKKLHIINTYSPTKGSLLDFGCGTGNFLQAAATNNWTAYGYEPDANARAQAKNTKNTRLVDSIKSRPNDLDIITAWHVIEHVSDLLATLKLLKKSLKVGGHLIIALPNHNSYDCQYYKEQWAAYDVPRHLYHFDQHSMNQLSLRLKMKIVDILPMQFDSYYVSMLSEKNIPNGNLLNALKVGMRSNQLATKSNEYSSLIYVLRK